MSRPNLDRRKGIRLADTSPERKPGIQAILSAVEESNNRRKLNAPTGDDKEPPKDAIFSGPSTSAAMAEQSEAHPDLKIGTASSIAARMLRRRHAGKSGSKRKYVTPVERARRLEDMRDKEDVAAFHTSRLETRLQALDSFINNALTDDVFLSRKEVNPWRFRRNENLDRRWHFVHNAMVTQELICAIRSAKEKRTQSQPETQPEMRESSLERPDRRESPDGESDEGLRKDTPKELSRLSMKSPAVIDYLNEGGDTDPAEEKPQRETTKDAISLTDPLTQNERISSQQLPYSPPVQETQSKLPKKTRHLLQRPKNKPLSIEKSSKGSVSPTTAESSWEPIIYAFGSHHRRDTCDYCGRTRCAGMRNRGKRKALTGKEGFPGTKGFMNERQNDIEGIYAPREKDVAVRFQKRLGQRLKELTLAQSTEELCYKEPS